MLDDLVQETLISLHGKLSSYDPERPFLPWLAAIARYRFVDHLRRITRASEVMLDDDVAAPPEQDAATARISLEGLFALISPAQAAEEIIAGFGRGSFEMHFPRRFTFWLKLLRLLPYRAYFPLARRLTGA